MDCRVDDGQIVPLRYRILCELAALPEASRWPSDAGAVLAYSDDEKKTITAALDEMKIAYAIEPVDQPDPAVLAACQGKVWTRSDALTALAAGHPPATLSDLAERVTQLETASPVAVEPLHE